MIWTTNFWKGTSERAIKTFFQTFVAVIGVNATGVLGVTEIDWLGVVSISVVSTLLSVATSIGNADFTTGANVGGR